MPQKVEGDQENLARWLAGWERWTYLDATLLHPGGEIFRLDKGREGHAQFEPPVTP